MKKSSNNGIARYTLYLETVNGNKYYFMVNEGVFTKAIDGVTPTKGALPAFDFLTANFSNNQELATSYGIDEEVSRVYLSYNFQGEKLLAPVFNNPTWTHIATTYKKGGDVDLSDKENLNTYNEIYSEIADLDSSFADTLLQNKNRLIHLSPRTKNIIVALRAHENAMRMKSTYGFPLNSSDTFEKVSRIYSESRYGLYQDLKKCLSNYRELRTVYLNYCKFKNLNEKTEIKSEDKPKRKVFVPPQQISIFDKPEGN